MIGLVLSVDTAWNPTLSALLSTRQSQRGPKKGHITALQSRMVGAPSSFILSGCASLTSTLLLFYHQQVVAPSLQYPLLSTFTNTYVCTENLQWQLSQQEGSKMDSSHAIPAHTTPEWDQYGGQAPREIEIGSGALDFSGLLPIGGSGHQISSASRHWRAVLVGRLASRKSWPSHDRDPHRAAIDAVRPLLLRPNSFLFNTAHHPGRQQGHSCDRHHASRLGPSVF